MRSFRLRDLLLASTAFALACAGRAPSSAPTPTPIAEASASAARATAVEWPAYGYDGAGTRYSPVAAITPANAASLQVAWTYRTGESTESRFATTRPTEFEATPIVADGTMYLSTPLGRVIALDPATGVERWVFDGHVSRSLDVGDFASRGVTAWLDSRAAAHAPCRRRIFLATTDARLLALDARTGRLCDDFGVSGALDLTTALRNPPRRAGEYAETSPPAVIGDLVVVGSSVGDNGRTDLPSGEVRAFDARTGTLRWSFDPVVQDSTDPNWRTWEGPTAHHTGAANVWSVIAVDTARGLVILPTTSPSPDYYGGERLGDNRYANSIVALRAATGRVVWHFQTVHHDLWDYDNASPPALVTIRKDGRARDVVIQATKTGQLFVLDRDTGVPVFPVAERAVATSDVPGERASRSQPFNTVIPPLSPQAVTADSIWAPTAVALAACKAMLAPLRMGQVYAPPSLQGTLQRPSNVGGTPWSGVAYDPVINAVIVPSNRVLAMVQLIDSAEFRRAGVSSSDSRLGYDYTRMRGTPYVMRRRIVISPDTLPCIRPPFATLTAIDMNSGARRWEVPLGSWSFAGVRHDDWGSLVLGGPIATAGGVVFQAGTLDRAVRAFDTRTGRELWRADLPAGARMTPMTYVAGGRQYVVVTAGGGKEFGTGDYVIAYALPR